MSNKSKDLLARLDTLSSQEVKRLLVEELTRKKLGLVWETDLIERDAALNADVVLPVLNQDASLLDEQLSSPNLIIEGDNFDSLRLLKSTHRGKIRVIYIDPPYNTGNKDWVYNDHFIKKDDRWKHSTWLEFMYQRLTLARDLLTPDGVILISINDENRSRLELLMDEVMPGRRLGSLVWRTKDTGNDFAQRLSHVHEHVLVYCNSSFRFNGRPTNRKKFRNPDQDQRGDWSPQPITTNKSLLERPNTYYPIQDPSTGYWRFASKHEIAQRFSGDTEAIQAALKSLRSDTIEQLIEKELIYFPPCDVSDVMQFESMESLLSAIKAGKGPRLPKKKTPLLRENLPDLEFWIGKPIAPGRPSRKEHWTAKPDSERLAPLSSWIAGINEDISSIDDEVFDLEVLRSSRGGVANDEIKRILGSKAFSYPKPLSLIRGLLEQATKPGDIILDFFAGSGTTGHAVMELNAQDGGNRRFILCSSTEANPKEPDKNICRDVCAERIRRVMTGYGDTEGLGGSFAYLTLDKVEEANLFYDATPAHAYGLLCLRELGVYRNPPLDEPVWPVVADNAVLVAVCPTVDEATLSALKQSGYGRAVVYSSRPNSMRDALEDIMEIETRSLDDVVRFGQGSKRAGAERVPAALAEEGAA
jgi:adenine-specific DNA-methyltransferase